MPGVPLIRTGWYNNDETYQRIYRIIALEGRLPPPDEITVLSPKEGRDLATPLSLGFAIPGERKVWFIETPPQYVVFAHELIHLARKEGEMDEEIYGYNLSAFIAVLAVKGILPRRNPLRLFEGGVTLEKVMRALRSVYNYNFKDITEYFHFIGVVPLFMLRGARPRDDDPYVVVTMVTELAAGSEYFDEMLYTLLALLEML
ncbi:MAG: hypothetical protein ACP5QE_06965 [Conexivisphaera sp.]